MRELEEEFQRGGEERRSRKKKQKKKMRVKEEKMDVDDDVVVESSREGLRAAAEVGLELTGESNDEKKKKKKKKKNKEKQRDVEADAGSGGTTEREVDEGAKLAVANDEKEEKKKKKKRKDEACTGHEDDVPSATDEGNRRVEVEKSEQVLKEGGESLEAGERRKKKNDNIRKAGKNLESFESGVLKIVSGDQEGRLESGVGGKLEEHCVQHGDGKSSKETKVKQKKRERNSEERESLSERDTIKPLKPVAEDERISEEGSSHGSHDGKSRKTNLEDENCLSSGETKKKKSKNEISGHRESILSNVSNRGLGTGNKLIVSAEETAGADNCKIQSSSRSGDEKKTRKKKKTKDGTAEDMNVSTEGISNTEIAGKNKETKNSRKRHKVSADERTSSVGNLDVSHASTTAETKKKVKKVNFSGHVEVFPSTDDAKSNDQSNEDGLVQGKRFSKEEDEMIKQAVFDYIEENHLGEDGLDMVLQCKSHRQLKDCWKEIGAALPWRPQQSIYWRAHTLFKRSESRKWEPEELDLVRRYYMEHGPKWKEMAELLGKHRVHVKDTWRRIKLTNRNKGNWSQEEYQALFDLVNVDLQLKAFEEKKTKHGMLRENISWGAISKKLSTRHEAACCIKWYMQLTSPMVTQGLWADTDDYCLIDALLKVDASCIEDVEWDSLLENRSGDLCLRRWKQMTRHIGGHQEKSFMDQVELLATRYCPNMLQFRTLNKQKNVVMM